MTGGATRSPRTPTVTLPRVPDVTSWATLLPQLLVNAAPWLRRQRWFGDKARRIAKIEPVSSRVVGVADDTFALLIGRVTFVDGGEALYFLPLAATHHPLPDREPLATIAAPDGLWLVQDAIATPRFQTWWLAQLEASAELVDERGAWQWRAGAALPVHLAAARTGPARMSDAEQSNSSVIYADALILKTFRKLQFGTNPDLEIGRFLAERTDYRHVPLLVGDIGFVPAGGEPLAIGMAQTFVPSVGDAWAGTLRHLSAEADNPGLDDYLAAARLLGERTGELHLALASDATDPAVAPEPISPAETDRWTTNLRRDIAQMAVQLAAADLSPEATALARQFIASEARIASRAAGFDHLDGLDKTRVHGDYHLGQVLRTVTSDFMILDFEGEPARPMAERRAKTSPLKDVAGMLRSFNYARATAERQAAVPGVLIDWERRVRECFLAGYRTACSAAPFLPPSDEAFAAAVAAWELDKAIYEIGYELNNRPDWVAIPLGAVLPGTVGNSG